MSRAVSVTAQVAVVAALARWLEPGLFASYAAAVALIAIVDALADFGLSTTAILRMGARPTQVRAIASSTSQASLVMLVVGLIVSLPLVLSFPADTRLAFIVLIPSVAINRVAAGLLALRSHRLEFGRLALAELVARIVPMVAIASFAVLTAPSSTVQLALIGAAAAVGSCAYVWLLYRGLPPASHIPEPPLRRLLLESAPIGIIGVVSLIHVRADQVLLELLGKGETLPPYALAYRVFESTAGILLLVSGAFFAVMTSSPANRRSEVADRSCRLVSLLAAIGAVLLFILSKPIGAVLAGNSIPDVDEFVRILAPAVWLSAVGAAYAHVCLVSGRRAWLLGMACSVTTVNILVGLAVIPEHGATGAAYATVATEALGVILVQREARRRMPVLPSISAEMAVVGVVFAAAVAESVFDVPRLTTMTVVIASAGVLAFTRRKNLRAVASVLRRG